MVHAEAQGRRERIKGETAVVLTRKLGLTTAVLIIIADVIGTGIFITTGEVLGMTGNALSVLILFGIGGVIAITGSLCYSEMATMWPDDGGEYVYLKRMFGMVPSFLSGWISMIIGFSLAAAMSAITAVNYFMKLFPEGPVSGQWVPTLTAAAIVVLFGAIHLLGVQRGSLVQNILTVLKLLIVVAFIGLGFYAADWAASGRLIASYPAEAGGGRPLLDYGAALIIIMYAYSGWNGTTYIAGEIKDPGRNLPRALFYGTLLITVLYVLMNVVYLMSAEGGLIMTEGKFTIGALAARQLFGGGVSAVFNVAIVVILLSSVSVQIMIGPRVCYAMAQDRTIFGFLGKIHSRFKTPAPAIILMTGISVFYVIIGFNAILKMLIYMGFALSVFPLLAVIGMVYYRYRYPEMHRPFRVPLFPLVPLIYILLMSGIIVTTLITRTVPSLFACGAIVVGIVLFYVWRYFAGREGSPE